MVVYISSNYFSLLSVEKENVSSIYINLELYNISTLTLSLQVE